MFIPTFVAFGFGFHCLLFAGMDRNHFRTSPQSLPHVFAIFLGDINFDSHFSPNSFADPDPFVVASVQFMFVLCGFVCSVMMMNVLIAVSLNNAMDLDKLRSKF